MNKKFPVMDKVKLHITSQRAKIINKNLQSVCQKCLLLVVVDTNRPHEILLEEVRNYFGLL